MDKFTIAASAASVALIGISAIAAWSPAAESRPSTGPSPDVLEGEVKAVKSLREACPPQYSLEDTGLYSADLPSKFERLASNSAFAAYAPANFGIAPARTPSPSREFGWLEAEPSIGNASGLAADGVQSASRDSEDFESGRNLPAASGAANAAEQTQIIAALADKLEDQVETAPVAIEQGEFVSVVAEPVEVPRNEEATVADDLLSSDALAFFATMSMEQIEAYSRLAAMIRHPELAEGIVPLSSANAGGLPPLVPDAAADEPEPAQAVAEVPPEWTAFESLDGDVGLLLGGDERTAVMVRTGTVVGALGAVDRIVKGESELAVLFEGGEAILGPALNRPPKTPVLRPAALKQAQR